MLPTTSDNPLSAARASLPGCGKGGESHLQKASQSVADQFVGTLRQDAIVSFRCALNGGPADLQVLIRDTLDDEIRIPAASESDGQAVYRLKRNQQGDPAIYGRDYHYAYRYQRSSADPFTAEFQARADSMERQAWCMTSTTDDPPDPD